MRTVINKKRLVGILWLAITLIILTSNPEGLNNLSSTNIVAAAVTSEYAGAELCGVCHPAEYAAWNQSYHNNFGLINITDGVKYFWLSPAWLHNGTSRIYVQLANATEGVSCANCHTTGYDSITGTWSGWNATDEEEAARFLGVQCEVCHGAGLEMSINYSSTLCGQCHGSGTHDVLTDLGRNGHNSTLQNVLTSDHPSDSCLHCLTAQGARDLNVTLETVGLEPVSCVVCHSPHDATNEAQLRESTSTDTCKQCHDAPPRHVNYVFFIEGPHEKAGLECTSCHGQGTHYAHGEVSTTFNHTFGIYNTYYPYNQTDPVVCSECHEQSWAITQLGIIQATMEETVKSVSMALENAYAAVTTAGQMSGVNQTKVTQAADLAEAASLWLSYVEQDGSSGFHNPEKAYELLSEVWRLAGDAEALARSAQQEVTASQLATTNMYIYVGAIIAIIAGLIIGLFIGRRVRLSYLR